VRGCYDSYDPFIQPNRYNHPTSYNPTSNHHLYSCSCNLHPKHNVSQTHRLSDCISCAGGAGHTSMRGLTPNRGVTRWAASEPPSGGGGIRERMRPRKPTQSGNRCHPYNHPIQYNPTSVVVDPVEYITTGVDITLATQRWGCAECNGLRGHTKMRGAGAPWRSALPLMRVTTIPRLCGSSDCPEYAGR